MVEISEYSFTKRRLISTSQSTSKLRRSRIFIETMGNLEIQPKRVPNRGVLMMIASALEKLCSSKSIVNMLSIADYYKIYHVRSTYKDESEWKV